MADTAEPGDPTAQPTPARPPEPPVAGRLGLWWVLAAGLVVGLVLVATTHLLRATAAFGGTLLLAAVIRAVLPTGKVGAIAVRSKWLDVLILVLGAAAVTAAGFTLNLAPLS